MLDFRFKTLIILLGILWFLFPRLKRSFLFLQIHTINS